MPTKIFGLEDSEVYALDFAQRTATELWMMFSTSAAPPNQYLNLKTPRNRSFYGYAQIMFGAGVLSTIELQFINQIIYYDYQCCPELHDAIACAIKALNPDISASVTPRFRPVTAVRFLLVPGCFANLMVSWKPFISDCGNEVLDPPFDQANPPGKNNEPADRQDQPQQSREDPYDPTPNDDGLPDTDKPGPLPQEGLWTLTLDIGPPAGGTQVLTGAGKSTDRVTVIDLPHYDDPINHCDKGRKGLVINGVIVDESVNCVSPVIGVRGPTYSGS